MAAARNACSSPPREILASIGTTAARCAASVFLCGAECPVSGPTAASGHDPEPGSDQEGPLRRREERCSQGHRRDHVRRQGPEG